MNDDFPIDELLNEAGPRPESSTAFLQDLKSDVKEVWQEHYQDGTPQRATEEPQPQQVPPQEIPPQQAPPQQTPPQRGALFLMAAALAATAVALALFFARTANNDGVNSQRLTTVATAARIVGTVELTRAGSTPRPLSFGDSVRAGDELRLSDNSGLALKWPNGRSIRLDQGTEVNVLNSTTVELLSGALYADSGDFQKLSAQGDLPGDGFTVLTSFGTVTPIGTRFVVRHLGEHGLRVRVRSGAVELSKGETDPATHLVAAGEGTQVDASGNVSLNAEIDPYSTEWSWISGLSSPPDQESVELGELLAWASYETGLQYSFVPSSLQDEVVQETVFGLNEQSPEEALEIALASLELTTSRDGRTITIRQD